LTLENTTKLIKKCIRGDQTAQRRLYELHRTRWYMLSLRYGKSKTQADDIFQEGIIQIFNDLRQFDSERGAFTTWSSRVLVNAALRFLKKHSWLNAISQDDQFIEIESNDETIYQQLAAKELTQLIQKLPVGYRLVFNMYVLEGYKHREIASELGITEGTSKSQLAKARKQLKAMLEGQLIHNYE